MAIKTSEAEGFYWDSAILAEKLSLKEEKVKVAIASLHEKKLIERTEFFSQQNTQIISTDFKNIDRFPGN